MPSSRSLSVPIFGSDKLADLQTLGVTDMQVVSVVEEKGGVGKTTTAMSLAAICAEASRTLVVDVDPQGSASWWAENAGERLPFDFTTEADPAILGQLRSVAA